MPDILLNDLLNFDEEKMENVKIKFNQFNGLDDPIELFTQNPEMMNTQYFLWRTKSRYFKVGQIAICLIRLSYNTWLLTPIERITKDLNVLNGINYEGEELEEFGQYYGRLVIKFRKTFQTQGRHYKSIHEELVVQQILSNVFDGEDLPSYDKVKITHSQLSTIIDRGKKDWIAALENQKAVYLITDENNGKHYIGSATSGGKMLLERWTNYAVNGHGGNKELVSLVNERGFDYIKEHYQYSILENYNGKIDDSIILKRESFWKEVLQSRKFSYNAN